MVISDECLIDKNLDLNLVAKVKTFVSMPNLHVIFNDEGFQNVTARYLGGFWVSLELSDANARDKFQQHKVVEMWFSVIQPWSEEFRVEERVIWLDVEGIPSVAWTPITFSKIANRWGKLLFVEDPNDNNLWRKRLCVTTKVEEFIMETFKVITKGMVSVIRAGEIKGWNPAFIEEDDEASTNSSDVESDKSVRYTDIGLGVQGKGSNGSDKKWEMEKESDKYEEGESHDPFGIYNLLHKEDSMKEDEPGVSDDLSKPPGFSNIVVEGNIENDKEGGEVNENDLQQENNFKTQEESRSVEKEQHSKCKSSSGTGVRCSGADLLHKEDIKKEAKPRVSDNQSKPPSFPQIMMEGNIENDREEGEVNEIDLQQENNFKAQEESRSMEKERHSECKSSSEETPTFETKDKDLGSTK
ncbi:hypothetical protein CTI12_AA020140 [Artemisia annua]|uniref:DUF4283 domain-containing protein n=1 Tax=Artemisia annua TaxID=35608 RepID=A0A2U1QJY7_ARTAN|nr:hypothetical protein CTI12_AA020140 [Artemisia annua]